MYQKTSRDILVDERTSVSSVWAVPNDFDPGVGSALVLAHGAGGGMNHEFIGFFHEGLASNGVLCVKFNFPYMEAGRRAPDRSDRLEDTFRKVLQAVTEEGLEADRIYVGGKSMGGRMASHLAAEGTRVAGLILLGYPLHPPGKPEQLRVAHFSEIRCPALFVQGTRDPLCDLRLLRDSLPLLSGPVDLHVIRGGDHSFRVLKSTGRTYREVQGEVLEKMLRWIQSNVLLE